VFDDACQDRQWGQEVDDTLNTPWMWCAYVCGYATKWMKNPHRWTHRGILRQDDPDEHLVVVVQDGDVIIFALQRLSLSRALFSASIAPRSSPP
jgi:hypothetical protein